MEKMNGLEYNTERSKMLIPEYGRNVQKMIDHALSLKDRDERNKVANAIIKVMGELKPQLRDVEEYKPKLWTHLFIMSEFNLDVDSPYPMPNREQLAEKPKNVAYPQNPIKIGHYGLTVEKMIKKAIAMDNGEERTALEKVIASAMKRFHLTFNTSSVEDELILANLSKLSDGAIQLSDGSFLPSTNEILKSIGGGNKAKSNNNHRHKNNNNRNNNNKNRNKNNRKRY